MQATLPIPRVVVTRPQPQADEWVTRLSGLGVGAVAFPLMGIEALSAEAPDLRAVWRDLPEATLVMFVSPNAVLRFFAAAPSPSHWPGAVLAAATGPGTAQALRDCGVAEASILQPDADSPRFDAETLWAQRLAERAWSGRRVLVVRGEDGRDWLADTLRGAGAEVHAVAAYRRMPPKWNAPERECLGALSKDPAVVWLFSSSQCIEHLTLAWTPDLAAALRRQPVLATHPRIARTAAAAGFLRVVPTLPDAVAVAQAARQILVDGSGDRFDPARTML